MEGWIKLHRKLLQNDIWETSTLEQKIIIITLLLMANHERKEWQWKNQTYTCEPGQVVTSLNNIAKLAGKNISIQNVRTAITNLEKQKFITNQSTKQGRLITICKYQKYQTIKEQANKTNRLTDQPTQPQQLITDNEPNHKQQQPLPANKQNPNKSTPNKKNKEIKEDNNILLSQVDTKKTFVKPTLQQVQTYCLERNNAIDPDAFINHYQANGWMIGKTKMKDWKAAVRTWENIRKKQDAQHPATNYKQTTNPNLANWKNGKSI